MTQNAPNDPNAYTEPCETFATLLKAMRTSRGISQSRLARQAGIVNSHVSRLEDGSRCPSRAMVDQLADALEATPIERFDLLVAAGYLPDDAQQFLTYWSRVPMATRIELTNLVIAMAEEGR